MRASRRGARPPPQNRPLPHLLKLLRGARVAAGARCCRERVYVCVCILPASASTQPMARAPAAAFRFFCVVRGVTAAL